MAAASSSPGQVAITWQSVQAVASRDDPPFGAFFLDRHREVHRRLRRQQRQWPRRLGEGANTPDPGPSPLGPTEDRASPAAGGDGASMGTVLEGNPDQADPSRMTTRHWAPSAAKPGRHSIAGPQRFGPIQPPGLALRAAWSRSVPQVSSPQPSPSSVPHHQVLHQSRSIGLLRSPGPDRGNCQPSCSAP